MTNLLLLDFETKDSAIGLDLGAGYIFSSLFKILGFSVAYLDTDRKTIDVPLYYRRREAKDNISAETILKIELVHMLRRADGIIAHNAQYELGILQYLGIDISHLKVYDTMVIAKLYDNNLFQYNLEALSKKYLNKDMQKNKDLLGEVVKKHKLLKTPKGGDVNPDTKTYLIRATKWAYSNMDKIQELEPEVMAHYCNQDLIATGNLFLKMVEDNR